MTVSPSSVSTSSIQYTTTDLENLKDLVNYYSWIYHEIQSYLGSNLLEVGAGIGTFAKVLIDNHVVPNSASIALCEPAQNLFPRLKMTIEEQYPELISSKRVITSNALYSSNSKNFDTIILINVLEHIENDVHFIQKARESLISSGRLILFVPAVHWLYSEFDREVGHYRRYTKDDLMNTLQNEGFDILKAIYMDLLGIIPWYLFNVIGKSKSINPTMAKLYDRIAIPLTKIIEQAWTPFLGKNVLLVGQKSN